MDEYKLKDFYAILKKRFEIHPKDIFVQFKKELYKCVSLSEFINLWPFLAQGSLECYSNI